MTDILILANSDIGLFNFRKELISKLIENENKVVIALPKGKRTNDLINLGCEYIELDVDRRGINPIKDLKLLVKYLKLVKKREFDIVITYTIKPNIYGGIACRLLNTPYISNITGLGTAFQKENHLKKLIVSFYKSALKRSQYIFFENEENCLIFKEFGIGNRKKIFPGAGVNIKEFKYLPFKAESKTRIVFIGRIMKEKGIEELLYVAKKMYEENKNIEISIVGELEESRYKEQLIEYENQGIVKYLGFKSDIKNIIEENHCVILPSYHEGLSNVLLEAAASGRAIITSNISGCKEVVDDKVTGLLVNPKDKASLYEKMNEFLALSSSEIEIMGKLGRKKIEKEFDRKIVVHEQVNLIIEAK